MKESKNNTYAIVAGICYGLCGLYSIITSITYLEYGSSITAIDIIYWIAIIGMATALFLKKRKIVIAVAGVITLFYLYYLTSYFSLSDLLDFIAYGLAAALILLALKKKTVVQKIWFTPGVLLLLGNLIGWIDYGYFSYISYLWEAMLFGLVEICGLIFIGLWLRYDFISKKPEPTAIGGADKLKMYNELLESGIITKEEFDAKKKQLLGL